MLIVKQLSVGSVFVKSFGMRFFSTQQKEHAVKIQELQALIDQKFPKHPFENGINQGNAKKVMHSYFAMSQAFPFLQAGAYASLVENAIELNQPISEDIEKTFAVGAFLCADEVGIHSHLKEQGMPGLSGLLKTRSIFHANLLREDLKKIFQEEINPNYCRATQTYLLKLMEGLGDPDSVKRSSVMVSFEMHAGRMITALWNSLSQVYPHLDKDSLDYFRTHVGGSDPLEVYHVELTQKLIQDLVKQKNVERFKKDFEEGYKNNIDWCAKISS